MDAFLELQTAC